MLVITGSIHGEEICHYTVSIWSIPIVDITMTRSDTDEENIRELEFGTKTTPLLSLFFPVDNQYKTAYDVSTFQMFRYEKKVDQKNVSQTLNISWEEKDSLYHSDKTKYKRTPDFHNIFSLMMRGRNSDWESIDTKWWNVDQEGFPYRVRYLWIDSVSVDINGKSILADHYRIDLVPAEEEPTQLVDITDVFTWGIALEECIRQIWIEKSGERRILRGEVKVKGITLIAEIKND